VSVDIDDLVRRGAESYHARDPEAGLELWDPDCEWHPFLSTQVEGAAGYRGHDGIRQWFGVDVSSQLGQLWELRGGRIVHGRPIRAMNRRFAPRGRCRASRL
jgi:hypothetical protein